MRLPPEFELQFTFARSSGPGGQNVNKVNTKAVLRWNLRESAWLGPLEKERLLDRLGPKLTRAGEVMVVSDRFRDQVRNKEDCLEKLGHLLEKALRIPKHRKATRPSRSSRAERRQSKSRQGEKKRLRGRVQEE